MAAIERYENHLREELSWLRFSWFSSRSAVNTECHDVIIITSASYWQHTKLKLLTRDQSS
jgi:hypothetical protein